MSDWTCKPEYLIEAGEACMSPTMFEERVQKVFSVMAKSPYPETYKHQRKVLHDVWESGARRLIWC